MQLKTIITLTLAALIAAGLIYRRRSREKGQSVGVPDLLESGEGFSGDLAPELIQIHERS